MPIIAGLARLGESGASRHYKKKHILSAQRPVDIGAVLA